MDISKTTPKSSPIARSVRRTYGFPCLLALCIAGGVVCGCSRAPSAKPPDSPVVQRHHEPPPKGIRSRRNPTDGAEVLLIPAGTFQMGSSVGGDEQPVHTVHLDAFWIYRTPVTVAQFRGFCRATGHTMPKPPPWGWKDDHPIVNINWDDALAYCQWAKTTLPTEAQWEYAARGGLQGKRYSWGDDWDGSRCANSVAPNVLHSTMPVDSYPPNGYGLYDMPGNVRQYCIDWYYEQYYSISPRDNPQGVPSAEERSMRGGSWRSYSSEDFRVAGRGKGYQGLGYETSGGFRCVIPATTSPLSRKNASASHILKRTHGVKNRV